MTPCPDEATILAFGRGEGDPQTRRMVEQHMAECDECRSLVGAWVRSSSMMPVAKPGAPVVGALAVAPTTPATPLQGGGAPSAETAAATPVLAPVKAGDVLAGKYVVERVLGAGGMGVVVAARHLQLDQRVALKFLLPEACKAPDAVARFLREGKAAACITSEHVARVIGHGRARRAARPTGSSSTPEGADLGANPQPLAWRTRSSTYCRRARRSWKRTSSASCIAISLPRIFLARRKDGSPLVKVLDFESRRRWARARTSSSRAWRMMMGLPRYMSPEQMISAKDVDARPTCGRSA
ncbi:MAG: hypothetical protein U0270_39300 [Labilithrix sp.]